MTPAVCSRCRVTPMVVWAASAPPPVCDRCSAPASSPPSLSAVLEAAGVPAEYRRSVLKVYGESGPGSLAALPLSAAGQAQLTGFPGPRPSYLYGTPGTGKSFTAAALLALAHAAGWPVRWVSVAELLAAYYLALREDRPSPVDALLRRPTVLVLDDVGKDTGTPAQATQIYRIVERYHTAGWPLVATSNLTPELLLKAYLDGGAIASRLLSGGKVRINREDRRLT